MQCWQLIDIPRPISSYCFYKDICPSPNLYPNLLQLPILHLYYYLCLHARVCNLLLASLYIVAWKVRINAEADMPMHKFYYFNIKGRAENHLLHIRPGSGSVRRHTSNSRTQQAEFKPKTPYMPVLQVDVSWKSTLCRQVRSNAFEMPIVIIGIASIIDVIVT